MGAFNKFLYGASSGSRGEARGTHRPNIFRLNWDPKGRKKNWGDRALPLSQGLDDRPSLSQRLDPALREVPLRTDFNPLLFHIPGAPKDGLLLNALKTLFRLSRVLLDLWKYILISAIKFISVRSSWVQLESFRNYQGFSIMFPAILDAN